MLLRIHFFPGLVLLALGLLLQFEIVRRLLKRHSRQAVYLGAAAATLLLLLGYVLEFQRVAAHFGVWGATWIECAALVELAGLVVTGFAMLFWDNAEFRPPRRVLLQTAAAGLMIAPGVVAAFGIVNRNRFRLSEVEIPVPNLPKDLQGLRIVQITDIHLSPFLSEREFAHAIDMANETRADVALVTGDLISRRGDPLDACLKQLARLRADRGVLGCLGNHEMYTGTQNYVTAEGRRIGIEFLRRQAKVLQFGEARINFAGVDYQKFHSPYLVGVENLIQPGALNILLSHNPDVFPVAARQGFDLTIAGHTHGGQVDFEILHQHLNVARVYTPYVRGLYRNEASSLYVSTGIGTIGVPIRIGAAPEVSLIRLCAI
jgi:predicted MPP superfamily phosphohydrolase